MIRALIPEDWLASLQIVVVEDQDSLRASLKQLLELQGASVLAVADAEEAQVELEAGARCDLLLTDVCMPGMGGPGLFDWVRSSRADLLRRLVFMTGDGSREVRSFVALTGRPWLAKPFEPSRLLEVLYGVYRDG